MRTIVFGIIGFAALAVSADAALVCASPPEMKVLQSAALQQQLAVAALSCHLSTDYKAFVAAYRDRLVQSDQALKAFFAARPRGEDYSVYKNRIANTVSLRSLHDAQFCDSAQKVFDMALGRRTKRNGLAPEPPHLIDTGYEGCRAVDDGKLIEARAIPRPVPRPQMRVAVAPKPANAPLRFASLQLVKPAPMPKPVVTPEAARALALAEHPKVVPAVAPKPAATPSRRVAEIVRPAKGQPNAPRVSADEDPSRYPQPSHATADEDPSRYPPSHVSADEDPSLYPQPSHPTADEDPSRYPPSRVSADEDPSLYPQPSYATADEDPGRDVSAPPKYGTAVERPRWRQSEDDPFPDDHIPNAYRPGSQWVRDAGPEWRPSDWQPANDGPLPHRHHQVMVRAPDGHWVVIIGHGRRWERD